MTVLITELPAATDFTGAELFPCSQGGITKQGSTAQLSAYSSGIGTGATTTILVGGGVGVVPIWTTATGSGAPVRATSPTLVTPDLGTPTAIVLTSATGLPLTTGVTGILGTANGGTGLATIGTALQTLRTNATATGLEWATDGGGTVTSVSVVTANGVSGSVATGTTTPAITITLGAITPTTVNGNTITTGTGTLTLAASKTLTANNTLTFAGTDGSTLNIGAGGTLGTSAYITLGANVGTALAIAVGSAGAFVTLNGALGTPSSGTLTNCAGLPAAGVTGTALVAADIGTTVQAYDADLSTWAGITPGANVGTALAIAVGSAGAFVTFNGALGTPSSGVGTNFTGTAKSLGIPLSLFSMFASFGGI